MAQATAQYLVTDKSPLFYNGKEAQPGDVLGDLPGESIGWLLDGGFITVVASDDPADPPADPSSGGE